MIRQSKLGHMGNSRGRHEKSKPRGAWDCTPRLGLVLARTKVHMLRFPPHRTPCHGWGVSRLIPCTCVASHIRMPHACMHACMPPNTPPLLSFISQTSPSNSLTTTPWHHCLPTNPIHSNSGLNSLHGQAQNRANDVSALNSFIDCLASPFSPSTGCMLSLVSSKIYRSKWLDISHKCQVNREWMGIFYFNPDY